MERRLSIEGSTGYKWSLEINRSGIHTQSDFTLLIRFVV